jgi:Protein of unknown function (DUF2939)
MTRSLKLPTIVGACTLLCLGAGFYATPYLTLNSMKNAIESDDSAAIAQHIDFPALRSSAKSEVQALLNRQTSTSDNFIKTIGMTIATPLVNPLVDGLVTPEGIKLLIKHSTGSPNTLASIGPVTEKKEPNISMGYESFNSFVVKLDENSLNLPPQLGKTSPSLVFSRSGLGWKLTSIRM